MHARQITYFLAVVDHGGIGRAAAALGVSQPTLSQSVRALERDLGADLFHRAGGGVVLSAAGRALLGPARQLIRDVQAARESVDPGADVPTLHLVAEATLGVHPAAALVASFRVAHPQVTVRLERPDPGVALTSLVRGSSSEVGLHYLGAPHPGLVEVELGTTQLLLVFPPDTPRPPGPVRLSALCHTHLIANPRGTPMRGVVAGALRSLRIAPRVVMELGHRGAILDLVGAGVGAALVLEQAAPAARARGIAAHPVDPPLRVAYGLVHRPTGLSDTTRSFIEHAVAS